jgi:dCTP diphosphatase
MGIQWAWLHTQGKTSVTNLHTLSDLSEELRRFAAERDWEQFHTPKNLAMALNVEAGELLEHFQWLTPEESTTLPQEKLEAVQEEIGDVLIYLARLADLLSVDLVEAAMAKHEKNRAKYPAEQA